MVEVSRGTANLDKAIRYFLGDKIVCKDFDAAVKLQQKHHKHIIAQDGTEFKQGMISGGIHKNNIFAVNLGQITLDRDIKRLLDEISFL